MGGFTGGNVADRALYAALRATTLLARGATSLRTLGVRRHPPPPTDGPLRVLLLAQQPASHAGTRHRLDGWARRLRREGHDVELSLPVAGPRGERLFREWSRGARLEYHARMLGARSAAVSRAPRFDVAVVHMNDLPQWEYGEPWVAAALRRSAGRLLVDLDDLPIVRGAAEPSARALRLVDLADGLVVGSRELARRFAPRPRWLVPTCVEPSEWPVPDRAARSGPRVVGWIGTSGQLGPLEALAPVLADACRRHGARVRVVCDRRPALPEVDVEYVPWIGGREAEHLAAIDVGLAPLAADPVSRCKCGLKAIQSMAVGAPVVASPVGALSAVVVHGESGFHARSADEWSVALDHLLGDRELRLRMGAAARTAVEMRWSYDAHAPAFESALRGVDVAGAVI